MALKASVVIAGRTFENVYIRIKNADKSNSEKLIINYGIFSSEETCQHGNGEKLTEWKQVIIPAKIVSNGVLIDNIDFYDFGQFSDLDNVDNLDIKKAYAILKKIYSDAIDC